MTTKDLIIQALDKVPESALPEILEYVRSQEAQHPDPDKIPESALPGILEYVRSQEAQHPHPLVRKEVWDAYQVSLQKRGEVYRRLANA